MAARTRYVTYQFPLKDKSGVAIIVDYLRDYTVVKGVQYVFKFFLF